MTQPAARAHRSAAPPSARRGRRLLAVASAVALGVGLGAASAPAARAADPSFCGDGTQPYATVAEVEAFAAGTAVTGKSVTHGTDPDPFTGSYIGYIDDALGKGKDMLLFKLSSPVIDGTDASGLKPAGIWAGMSGSPVYTADNKLIGAVAYSLNYDNLPVAGVTPAEYMKTIGSNAFGTAAKVKVTKGNLKATSAGVTAAGASLVGRSFTQVRTVNIAGAAGDDQNALVNRTLARTPKSAKGSAFLRSRSFMPAGVNSADAVPEPLVAGGSIAVLYGEGDVLGGGIGTVTAICGSGAGAKVWAFGHPMFQDGKTSMMMANVSTALIVPDATGWVGSYKQQSKIGAPIGIIDQDRAVGIRGTVGAAPGFPLTVAVQDKDGAAVETYSGHISYPSAAASGFAYLIAKAVNEQMDKYGAGTGQIEWTINYRRADGTEGSFTNSQIVADAGWFPDMIGNDAGEDVYSITGNPYEDVTITGLEATVKLISEDSLVYKVSGAQVQDKAGAWGSLSGAKLKAGGTYVLRPQYTVKKNGKSSGTAFGEPLSVKLSSKARKSGSLEVSAASELEVICDEDDDECDDWYVEEDDFADFGEYVAWLDDHATDDMVVAELAYKLKKGSTSKSLATVAPGVVYGSTSVPFSVKS